MIRRALAAAAVTVLALAVPAPPASAHSSSYCGHGQVGTWTTVTFLRHYTSPISGRHIHIYDHRRLDLWRIHGDVARSC